MRPYTPERDAIAVDAAVITGRRTAVHVLIRPEITATQILAAALAQIGLTDGIEKYNIEDSQTGTPMTGSIWSHGSKSFKPITQTMRITKAKAMIALDDIRISSLRTAIAELRKEKEGLHNELGGANIKLVELGNLQTEHAELKHKFVETRKLKSQDKSAFGMKLKLREEEFSILGDKHRSEIKQLGSKNNDVLEQLSQAQRTNERLSFNEKRVEILEQAIRAKDDTALKTQRQEQELRERMERKHEVTAQRETGGSQAFLALQTCSKEKDAVIELLRCDRDAAMQRTLATQLTVIDMEQAVADVRAGENSEELQRNGDLTAQKLALLEEKHTAEQEVQRLVEQETQLSRSLELTKTKCSKLETALQSVRRLDHVSRMANGRVIFQVEITKASGIGMSLMGQPGNGPNDMAAGVYVKGLRSKGPAEQAGVRRADQIVDVDGKFVLGWKKDDVVNLLKETKDTLRVTFTRKKTHEMIVGPPPQLISAEDLAALRKTLEEKEAELSSSHDKLGKSDTVLAEVKQLKVALETERDSLLTKLKGNTDASESTRMLVASFETQVKTHESKIASLIKELASKETDVLGLQTAVKEAKQETQTGLAQKDKQFEEFSNKANGKTRELKDTIKQQVLSSETALKEVQDALELRVEEAKMMSCAADANRQAIRDGEGVISQLRKEKAELHDDLEKLQSELGTARDEQRSCMDDIDAKRSAVEKDFKAAKEAIEQLKAEHSLELLQVEEKCGLEVTSLETRLMSAQQVREKATKELNELQAAHQGLIDRKQTFDDSNLHEQLEELARQLKSAETAKESSDSALAAAIKSLKADADTKDEIILKLQADLEAMSRDGSQQLYVLQNQVVTLQNQVCYMCGAHHSFSRAAFSILLHQCGRVPQE